MVAAAVVGAAVVGAAASSDASRKASNAQKRAAEQATNTEMAMFNQNREDMQPWREAGTVALNRLTGGVAPGGEFAKDFTLADFQRDPGYQFRMSEGAGAVEGSAAARGGVLSGATLKALSRFGQDFASNEYGNAYNRFNSDRNQRWNRLSSIAGIGQTATRDVATMGSQVAGQVADNMMQAGNARASGYVGRANAISGGVNTLAGLYGMGAFNGAPAAAPAPATAPVSAGRFGDGYMGGGGVGYGTSLFGG